MAIFKTLADLKKKTDKPANTQGDGERIPRFFSVKPGEEFKIRFRQELTEDSSGFNEEAGVAELIAVHAHPDDFTKNARCTADMEEYGYKCWACSQVPKDRGWRAKSHLLINVAVFNKEENVWEPRVLDQKFTPAHVAETVVEYASEYGTVLDRDYKIKRKGQKQETQYTLVPMAEKAVDDSIAELPYHDLNTVYRTFAPAEQEGFYNASDDKGGASGWE